MHHPSFPIIRRSPRRFRPGFISVIARWVSAGVYHKVSGPVRLRRTAALQITPTATATWGCKGLAPRGFAIPCPWPFPWHPAHASRATDAALKPKGKGCAPAPPRAAEPRSRWAVRLARRWRGGKVLLFTWLLVSFRPSRRLPTSQGSVSSRVLGAPLRGDFCFRSPSLYGQDSSSPSILVKRVRRASPDPRRPPGPRLLVTPIKRPTHERARGRGFAACRTR